MKPEDRRRAEAEADEQDVASASECTGLMPALPPDDDAQRSCAALYAVHMPKAPGRMFRRK